MITVESGAYLAFQNSRVFSYVWTEGKGQLFEGGDIFGLNTDNQDRPRNLQHSTTILFVEDAEFSPWGTSWQILP